MLTQISITVIACVVVTYSGRPICGFPTDVPAFTTLLVQMYLIVFLPTSAITKGIYTSYFIQEMHEQMSGYKRMRREHQAALLKLEERCKADVDAHKAQLDREYDALLQQLSRELERLQVCKYSTHN